MSNRFKILCPECASKAVLATIKNTSTQDVVLQCCCSRAECGHTFSLIQSYSHSLNEPHINTPITADKKLQARENNTKFKIRCPACGENATIRKSNRKHVLISDLYCSCNNPECGHRFVSTLSFSHSLSPSAVRHGRLINDLMQSIAPSERDKAIELLRQASQALKAK